MPETVAVTGGNRRLGRGALAQLHDDGYRAVNLSRGNREEDTTDSYLTTDLLGAGKVYGSLAKSDADAVVHFGMLPTPELTPGYRTYESNVMSSYHVLEAAGELGIETVALASSPSAIGAGFEPDPVTVGYLPVDEEHRLTPSIPTGWANRRLRSPPTRAGPARGSAVTDSYRNLIRPRRRATDPGHVVRYRPLVGQRGRHCPPRSSRKGGATTRDRGVTVLELYEGIARAGTPEEKRKQTVDVLELAADRAMMRKAGKLSGQLITDGRQIKREDCIIAATGLLHDDAVVTRNADHFERVDGLAIHTY